MMLRSYIRTFFLLTAVSVVPIAAATEGAPPLYEALYRATDAIMVGARVVAQAGGMTAVTPAEADAALNESINTLAVIFDGEPDSFFESEMHVPVFAALEHGDFSSLIDLDVVSFNVSGLGIGRTLIEVAVRYQIRLLICQRLLDTNAAHDLNYWQSLFKEQIQATVEAGKPLQSEWSDVQAMPAGDEKKAAYTAFAQNHIVPEISTASILNDAGPVVLGCLSVLKDVNETDTDAAQAWGKAGEAVANLMQDMANEGSAV